MVLHAQEPATFEVVSIKPNNTGGGRSGIQSGTDGAFLATNVTLRRLILDAFGLQDSQLVGGPDWISTDRFDVVGTGQKDDRRNGERERAMLADRFHVVTHTEKHERPVFNLVLLRADRSLGSAIKPAAIDCHGGVDDPDKARREANLTGCGLRTSGNRQGTTVLGGGRSMAEIARMLADFGAERQVFDKTGLNGFFDFELKWVNQPGTNAEDVTFFAAVQEQLGLKLEAATAPVEILIIDRAERPDPN